MVGTAHGMVDCARDAGLRLLHHAEQTHRVGEMPEISPSTLIRLLLPDKLKSCGGLFRGRGLRFHSDQGKSE